MEEFIPGVFLKLVQNYIRGKRGYFERQLLFSYD